MRELIGKILEYFLGYNHKVKFKLDKGAQIPFQKYIGDAGMDLYACRDVGIPSHATVEVFSGVYIDSGINIWMEIKARSSTIRNKNLEVIDAVIDAGYRGSLMAIVHNPTGEHKYVRKGERIVQIVPHRVIPIKFVQGKLSKSSRDINGFGSSGV